MVTIVSVTSQGGGFYHVVFSQPVTWTIATSEPDLIMKSAATGNWKGTQTTGQIAVDTIEFEENDDDDDCVRFAILSQPNSITSVSGDRFDNAHPTATIP